MHSAPYDWAQVPPLGKAPRLNPTLVLSHTPQELADKLAPESNWCRCERLLREAATAIAELHKQHPHIEMLDVASGHADDAFDAFQRVTGEQP